MANIKLNKAAANDSIKSYLSHESYRKLTSSKRLILIQSLLAENGEANLEQVLQKAFPNAKDPLNALSQTAKEIQKKAAAIGLQLILKKDNFKKKALAERIVWLEGADLLQKRVLIDQQQNIQQPDSDIKNRATRLKRTIQLCVCYAPEDAKKAKELTNFLKDQLSLQDKNYLFELIEYDAVIIGGNSTHEMLNNMLHADLLLLFESTKFHINPFFKKHLLLEVNRMDLEEREQINHTIVTEQLYPIDFNSIGSTSNRSRLNGIQAFEWLKKEEKKSYCSLRSNTDKESFAQSLASAINEKIKHLDQLAAEAALQESLFLEGKIFEQQQLKLNKKYVPSRGRKERFAGISKRNEEGSDIALDLLLDWLREEEGPKLFALLGQYGMGKTFTSRVFVEQQIERFKAGKSKYIPLYFDLRDFEQMLLQQPGFDIWTIIRSILHRRKAAEETNPLQVADIKTILAQYPTLLVFDGLDEVIIHVDNQQLENHFLEEILKLLPNFQSRIQTTDQTGHSRKMLLTCRTDYFKTLAQQTSFFQAQNRKHIDASEDYACCIILPFNEAQIKTYLEAVLPEKETDTLYKSLQEIHNLAEISQRPVLLDFLVEIIDDIETLLLEKQEITTATIYQRLIAKSFERDGEKHEIPTAIKLELLEELAAHLWKRSSRRMEFDKLATFVGEYLDQGTAAMKKLYYQKDEDTLGKDLRNATLLVRSNEEEFGFSHKSFQEYFLAKYLLRHLTNGNFTALEIPNINKETIDFIFDLLKKQSPEDLAAIQEKFKVAMKKTGPDCRQFIFKLYLRDQGQILGKPKPLNLEKLHFENFNLSGSPSNILDLSHASFKKTKIDKSTWRHVNLDHTNFNKSRLRNTHFRQSSLNHSEFKKASVQGIWRNIAAEAINLKEADFQYTQVSKSQWNITETAAHSPQLIQPHHPNSKKLQFRIPGHSSSINYCVIIDKNKALSCSYDQSLILWDLNSGKQIHQLMGHNESVQHCVIIDKDKALSCSYDQSLILWDLNSGKQIHQLMGHNGNLLHCVIIDNNKALSCSSDQSLILWDLNLGKQIHQLMGHNNTVTHCAIIDNNKALSCSKDNSLILWDLNSGKQIHQLMGHNNTVTHCAIIDNNKALSCSKDNSLILWDLNSGKQIHQLKGHNNTVTHCAIIDNNKALSCSSDQSLILWDLNSGKQIHQLMGHNNTVTHCAIIDNNKALSCSYDQSLILWDLNSGKQIHQLKGHNNTVTHCAIIDNNKALSCSKDNSLILWDLNSGKQIHQLKGNFDAMMQYDIIDNNKALSCSKDNSLILWDLNSGKQIHQLKGHDRSVRHCAIINDNKALSCSYDQSLILWDLNSGKQIHRLKGHNSTVMHCDIDDNKALSCSSDNSLILWDLNSGKQIHQLKGHDGSVRHCAIINGNKALSCSYDNSLILWDLNSGKQIHQLKGHNNTVMHCDINDNKALSCSSDNSLILWDLNSGKQIHQLKGHDGSVRHCAIINGNKALSCSYDNSLILWDLNSGKQIHQLKGHNDWLQHFTIIDNNKALSCSDDHSLILWDLKSGKKIRQFKGHNHWVIHCALIGNNKALSCSSDRSLILWDLNSGQALWQGYHLGESGYASLRNDKLLDFGGTAWEYLDGYEDLADSTRKHYHFDELIFEGE